MPIEFTPRREGARRRYAVAAPSEKRALELKWAARSVFNVR
ncbi:MAG: hypothetical protein NZ953_02825 [Thaumarchaeota archaeon]|nr:hypothetical protein [Candidatus Calditenuaceae archaeon]MCX8203415.1 hypothetical protein [Nitrososphaeria archaeon]MDW8042897.1 hypothetical protein [Nitrososphaerota archaeon]